MHLFLMVFYILHYQIKYIIIHLIIIILNYYLLQKIVLAFTITLFYDTPIIAVSYWNNSQIIYNINTKQLLYTKDIPSYISAKSMIFIFSGTIQYLVVGLGDGKICIY